MIFNLAILISANRKIFLGDAGSTFIGLFVVFVLIRLSDDQTGVLRVTAAPWLIGLPLIDMCLVIVRRTLQRKSPFRADRGHIHHALLTRTGSKWCTLLLLLAFHIGLVSVGVIGSLEEWPDPVMFWGMLPILFGAFFTIRLLRSH